METNSSSIDDFKKAINYVQLIMFVQESYVDFRNVDDAIKKRGTKKYLDFNIGSFTSLMVKISENDYAIEKDYFSTGYDSGSFYSVSNYETSYFTNTLKTSNGAFGRILIKLEDFKTDYNVKIYSFYDFIAQLGGIYEFLFELMSIVGFYITKKIFDHSLLQTISQSKPQSISVEPNGGSESFSRLTKSTSLQRNSNHSKLFKKRLRLF